MEQTILIQMSQQDFETFIDVSVQKAVKKYMPTEKRYYTIEELAKKLKVQKTTIHNWINSGIITASKIGGRTLMDADEIDKMIKENKIFKYQHKRGYR